MNPPATATRPPIFRDHALQQAGLHNVLHQAGDFELSLRSGVSLLRVHSLQPRAELDAALAHTGICLPERVNQASGQDPSALCLAPSDWLLFSETRTLEQLQAPLQAALDPGLTAVLDQSAALAVFRLAGSTAAWLLSKCAGLDWRRMMANGQHCCRTKLDRLPAILHYHQPGNGSGAPVFDVMLERSLARHGWQMLLDRLPHARELEQQHGPLRIPQNDNLK
jgi:heterotetrameric sarcosine oxidase gamma subunit